MNTLFGRTYFRLFSVKYFRLFSVEQFLLFSFVTVNKMFYLALKMALKRGKQIGVYTSRSIKHEFFSIKTSMKK